MAEKINMGTLYDGKSLMNNFITVYVNESICSSKN